MTAVVRFCLITCESGMRPLNLKPWDNSSTKDSSPCPHSSSMSLKTRRRLLCNNQGPDPDLRVRKSIHHRRSQLTCSHVLLHDRQNCRIHVLACTAKQTDGIGQHKKLEVLFSFKTLRYIILGTQVPQLGRSLSKKQGLLKRA